MKKLSIAGALALFMVPAAHATTIGTFSVSVVTGTVSIPGAGLSGPITGTGTGTLDDVTGLTYSLLTNAQTQLTNSNQTLLVNIAGTPGGTPNGQILSDLLGFSAFSSCANNGGAFNACTFLPLGPQAISVTPAPLAFDLNFGGTTVLTAVQTFNTGGFGLATMTTNIQLTTVPEPGPASLLGLGLLGLALTGRKRSTVRGTRVTSAREAPQRQGRVSA